VMATCATVSALAPVAPAMNCTAANSLPAEIASPLAFAVTVFAAEELREDGVALRDGGVQDRRRGLHATLVVPRTDERGARLGDRGLGMRQRESGSVIALYLRIALREPR
jgi:hypothetical protein